ncbi:hypothetical protein LZQ00_04035 [Sphingobacterium sp. SRCM116780]|uniref:hypothetical protein n=1 Tax=Sphingobacterium sp. SRCM116780 TaxID=2907623 RepID=UPI001F251839|nr:hypothetical protein [Sphingobacterium sp. SRCM116780]UIR56989.1 hypothetical protein LZQ00_04035 [Sphingobacterium sp. SRCM116780]
MKSRIFSKKNVTWILLLSLLCCVMSCRKSDDSVSGEESGKIAVQFKVGGIIEGGKPSALAKAASLNEIKLEQTGTVFVKETALNKDYNMVTTITADAPAASVSGSSPTGAKASNNRAAWTTTPGVSTTTPVPANLQYRVLVFDDNGDRVKISGSSSYINSTYTASTQSQDVNAIKLDAGKYYYFVALAALTSPSTAPGGTTAITRIEDVLFDVDRTVDALHFVERQYVGNKTESGNHIININFKHVNSKVTLSVEASPEMGNITATTATISGAGKTNLASDGTKTAVAGSFPYNNITLTPFTYSSSTAIGGPSVAKSSAVFISSAGTVNGNPHTISIPSVAMNGGTARTDIPNIVVPAGTFASGVSYTVHITFQPTGIKVGGLIWARGNLSYDWTNKIYFNRYYPQESGSNYMNTDFWHWGNNANTLNPPLPKRVATNEGIDYTAFVVDPCSMVAGGKWRTPTLAEYAALGVFKVHDGSGAEGATTTAFTGGTAYSPNGSLANTFPYIYFDGTVETIGGAERLRFYKNGRYWGQITAADMTNNINGPAYGTYGIGNTNTYEPWTAQYMVQDPLTQNDGTPYPAGNNSRLHPVRVNEGSSSGGTKNFLSDRPIANDLTYTEDDRIPIRCVKNP